ncbi:hypothetical protein [Dyella jiangningensis]
MNTETQKVDVSATIEFTPEMIAAAFWEMDSEHQADFFAELERIAGVNLCFQMAWVVREMVERADRGNYQAQKGFQTMLSHAKDYVESATDIRYWRAQHEIRKMTDAALARVGGAA